MDFIARGEFFATEHRQIQEIEDRMRKVGLNTSALLVQGSTVETILKEATKSGVDMIVVGSHGRDVRINFL